MDLVSGQVLFLLFSFLLSCFLIFITSKSHRTTALAPGPPRLPVIGNIHLIGKNPHHSFAELSKTYGGVMSLKLGRVKTVVISSPEAAKEVLRTHDQVVSGRFLTNAILSVKHHEVSMAWLHPSSALFKLLRKLSVTHLFSPQRIEATKALRMKKMEELLKFIKESSEREEEVDISRVSFTTVLNIISNILFSVDFSNYDSSKSVVFQNTVIDVMETVGNPDIANFFPFLRFLDLQGNGKKVKECSERMFKIFRGFIEAKIEEKSSSNSNVLNKDFTDELVDLMKGDETELINMNTVEHLLADLFTAGTDTNSSTVEWAMAELLRNPETMAKAQAELNNEIGQNGVVQESDISQLPYLQAVVKETFRLHPPTPLLLPRVAETDVEVLGFLVAKDTQILVNVWAIGRDPNVWENPLRFEPERFLGKVIDVKGTDFELTPFGAGRRICPALTLAVKIVSFMLASLLYSFDWKLPNGVVFKDLDMEETFGITLHKSNPLHAVPVKKRVIT